MLKKLPPCGGPKFKTRHGMLCRPAEGSWLRGGRGPRINCHKCPRPSVVSATTIPSCGPNKFRTRWGNLPPF
eukprot:1180555-Prorocentrum_minimum.AAC.9